jgi:hypothetical protein
MKGIAYSEGDRIALGIVRSPTHFVAVSDIAPELPASLISILEQEDGLTRLQQAAQGRQGRWRLAYIEHIVLFESRGWHAIF